jgi:hypothetical protein
LRVWRTYCKHFLKIVLGLDTRAGRAMLGGVKVVPVVQLPTCPQGTASVRARRRTTGVAGKGPGI